MNHQKSRVAIIAPRIDFADAVGNDIRGMKHTLDLHGYETRLFAEGGNVSEKIYKPETVAQFVKSKHDVAIYHHAVAWVRGIKIYQQLNCRRIYRYHNVTPGHFYLGYHPGIVESCEMGRQQVLEFKKIGSDLVFPASEFSKLELLELGFDTDKMRVVYPFHRVDELLEASLDTALISSAAMGLPHPRPFFLSVGRLAPNKGLSKLLAIFASYLAHTNSGAKLVLVGGLVPGLEKYYSELKELIKNLFIENSVIFAGKVSESTLKSLYLSATAFITLSDHEGFCVPVVEAIALGAPVLTSGGTALDHTGADAVLNLRSDDKSVIASAMFEMEKNSEMRQFYIDAGKRVYQAKYFSKVLRNRFMSALWELNA